MLPTGVMKLSQVCELINLALNLCSLKLWPICGAPTPPRILAVDPTRGLMSSDLLHTLWFRLLCLFPTTVTLQTIRQFGLVVTNALASINVVALRQTRLVLGWVTVCGRVNHLDM